MGVAGRPPLPGGPYVGMALLVQPAHLAALRALATVRGVSVSELVREAIAQWLGKGE